MDGADGTYGKGAGTVIAIPANFGLASNTMSTSDSEAPYFAAWMNRSLNSYGFWKFTVSASRIDAQYVAACTGTYSDQFAIVVWNWGIHANLDANANADEYPELDTDAVADTATGADRDAHRIADLQRPSRRRRRRQPQRRGPAGVHLYECRRQLRPARRVPIPIGQSVKLQADGNRVLDAATCASTCRGSPTRS